MRTLKNRIPPQKSIHSKSFEKQANKIVKTEYSVAWDTKNFLPKSC